MNIDEQLAHLDHLLLSSVRTEFPEPLTDSEKAAVHAYLVLAHAVIEEYIEDGFLRYFEKLNGWVDDSSIPEATVRMLLTASVKFAGKTPNLGAGKSLNDVAKVARIHVEGTVKANNGIKSNNVKTLSLALGVNWTAMDYELSTEIADLEALGAKRGEAGHLSPFTEKSVQLTKQDYPEDVRVWVKNAHIGADSVVGYLHEYLSKQVSAPLILDRDGN